MTGTWVRGGRRRLGVALAILTLPLAAAQAQEGCDGLRVRSINIARSSPAAISPRLPGWMASVARVALQSTTTHAAAVRPFLLLRDGEPCSELRRRESERVLRAQAHLADASVLAVPDGQGGVDITVETVDEFARVLGGQWAEGALVGVRLGSNNLQGQGVRLVGEWTDGGAYPDGFRGEVELAHTFGQPHRARAVVERQPFGNRVAASWERPFWSKVQRFGWYAGADVADGHAQFVRPEGLPLALGVENRRLDVGSVFRIGGETFGMFAGPFVTLDQFAAASNARAIGPNGFENDQDSTLNNRYRAFEGSRASVVLGGRWLNFLRVEGFDALEGPQDIGRGTQVMLLSGLGFGGDAGTRYMGGEVFAGAGASRSYVALRGFVERRAADNEKPEVIAAARLRWHFKLSADELWTLSAEFAGGWQARRPFQLALGEGDVGVRGFRWAPAVGAHRAVLRGDYRRRVGAVGERVVLAWSSFADLGAVDAGDAPFGQSSGPQASVGVGLLATTPRQSASTWRLELALPLGPQALGTTELRLKFSSPLEDFWSDASDVRAVRAVIPPSSLLGFP